MSVVYTPVFNSRHQHSHLALLYNKRGTLFSVIKEALKSICIRRSTPSSISMHKEQFSLLKAEYKMEEEKQKKAFETVPINTEDVNVQTLIISCIDFRIERGIQSFATDYLKVGGEHDLFCYPGSSLEFIVNQQMMIANIGLFMEIHKVSKIVLIDHLECGAYEKHCLSTNAIKSKDMFPDVEYQIHVQNLKLAKNIIKQYYPQLTTDIYLYRTSGLIEHIDDNHDLAILENYMQIGEF